VDWSLPPERVDPFLDAARLERDPLGDAAVSELLRSGAMRGGGAGGLVAALEKSNGPAARALLDFSFSVPSWVDFSRMKAGTQLGLRTPVQSALALILGSLIESYGAARGAKVLVRSGALTRQVIQRLHDTTTFVLEIAASRGPQPGSYAHRHILRTRLIHCFVRHGMDRRGDWNRAAWGEPVNQEDLAWTLMVFCHVYLRSMGRLGFALSAEQEDSIHHIYRWVGHLMGIHSELLTTTRADETALYAHVRRRQLHPDDDSRLLARSLVQGLAMRRPFFLPAGAIATLARHVVGPELADGLHLKASMPWGTVTTAVPLLSRAQRQVERVGFTHTPIERLGERVARLVYRRGFDSSV
jgi:hypothetical protein